MANDSTIETVLRNRDAAMAALDAAYNAVGDKREQGDSDDLKTLWQALADQRSAIMKKATDDVLALPSVVAAAGQISTVSAAMTAEAGRLKSAANVLTAAGSVLKLGQQFEGLIKAG